MELMLSGLKQWTEKLSLKQNDLLGSKENTKIFFLFLCLLRAWCSQTIGLELFCINNIHLYEQNQIVPRNSPPPLPVPLGKWQWPDTQTRSRMILQSRQGLLM